MEFYFYGTKLVLMDSICENRTNSVEISIDNNTETFSCYSSLSVASAKCQICTYEKHDLERKIHHIKITNNDSSTNRYLLIDCIDIDEDGYMVYCDDNGKLYYDVTPIMTSNTTPSPYVAESNSEYDSAHRAWYLFDGNLDPNAAWASSASAVSNIYVTLSLNKKMNTIFIRGCSNRLQNPKDISIMGSNDNSTFDNILDYEISIENSGTLLINTKTTKYKYYKLLCKNNNGANNIALVELRYLLAVDTPFYLIQDNSTNKIYNYDEDINQLVEVTDISILKENALNNTCIYDLNKVLPLIDLKQPEIRIISNKDIKSIVNSIKADKQLILANNDFSTRIADNIDYFKSEYSLSDENCVIKTVISIDSGVTWYSYIDGNWTQLVNTVACKTYEELSDSEKQQWGTFLDEVLEKGINISNIETLDFNLLNSEKIRFAYAIQIEDGNSEATLKNIKWQFDSIGTYNQLSPKTEVNISMSNNEIKIQPLKDTELMKINVGISSQVPQDFDTSGLLDKETFKGKEINSVKKADVAKEIEIPVSEIDGARKYYGTDNNDGGMSLRPFPAGTHTEHVDTYTFDNLTLNVPQTIPFVKEIPEINCFPIALKYEDGLKNKESILEKYSNSNITIKTNNVECDSDGLRIKDEWIINGSGQDEDGYYKININMNEFTDINKLEVNK